jgi:hypothetical protein
LTPVAQTAVEGGRVGRLRRRLERRRAAAAVRPLAARVQRRRHARRPAAALLRDRGFEYETFGEALLALILYDGHGDPLTGWTRAYPPHFRRRPGGDPNREVVRR